MGLCLMVYSLGQREVRRQLFDSKNWHPQSVGKINSSDRHYAGYFNVFKVFIY